MPSTVQRLSLATLVVLGLGALISFGIVGIGRSGTLSFDGAVLYAAGRLWLAHENAYDHAALVRSVQDVPEIDLGETFFFYPPQTAAFCVPLALLPYPVAKVLWVAVNLLAVAVMVLVTVLTVRQAKPEQPDEIGAWVLAAVVLGNPFTAHIVWMGQTSLVAGAAVMASWFFARRQQPLAAGICLGLATFKPQLCLLLLVWYLLERSWKVLLAGGITAAVMALYPAIVEGPIGALQTWRQGLTSGYQGLEFNAPGNEHVVGVQSMLAAANVSIPGLTIVGVLLTAGLWLLRKKVRGDDVLGLLMALTFIFVGYSHDYDFVCLVPLWTAMWLRGREQPRARLVLALLLLLLFVPQRLLRPFGSPVLFHWRTPVLILTAVLVLLLSMKSQGRPAEAKAAI